MVITEDPTVAESCTITLFCFFFRYYAVRCFWCFLVVISGERTGVPGDFRCRKGDRRVEMARKDY